MNIIDFLFYADAFLILACAAIAVSMRHLLHAALALMMSLFCTAGLFILLRAEFAALVQVMVYIGGVIVFIVYTILLTAQLGEDLPRISLQKNLGAASAALAFGALLLFVLWRGHAMDVPANYEPSLDAGGLRDIGRRLLSSKSDGFVVPFEIVSLLLLAALIGAVSIARKPIPQEDENK
jgi:NADH-quinone oxidoreductase subunit J